MTTNYKRIVAYHMARLKDKDKRVRLRSVAELADIPDRDALDVLRTVFETDTDIEVRRAAQEAGRALYSRLKQGGSEEP